MGYNKENDRLLEILSNVESGIAKIYKRFSTKKASPNQSGNSGDPSPRKKNYTQNILTAIQNST